MKAQLVTLVAFFALCFSAKSAVIVDFISTVYQKTTWDIPGVKETAEFEFVFDVTAFDSDIYIGENSVTFSLFGDGETFTTNLGSTADYELSNFVVKEFDTERFFLSILVTPNSDDYFRIGLQTIAFGEGSENPIEFNQNFSEDFKSKTVYLNTNQIPEPCPVIISITSLIFLILYRKK